MMCHVISIHHFDISYRYHHPGHFKEVMPFKVQRIRHPSKRNCSISSSNIPNCEEGKEGGKNSVLINVDIGSHRGAAKSSGKCFPTVASSHCGGASGSGVGVETDSPKPKQRAIKVINGARQEEEVPPPPLSPHPSGQGGVGGQRRKQGGRKMKPPTLKNNLTTPLRVSQPQSTQISNLVLPPMRTDSPINLPVQWQPAPVTMNGGDSAAINTKKQDNNAPAAVVKEGNYDQGQKMKDDDSSSLSLPPNGQLSPVPKNYYHLAAGEMGDWMDDDDISFPSPWATFPEQETLLSSLRGVQYPSSPIKAIHSDAKKYAEKGQNNDTVDAIQSLGNLLPEDFLKLYQSPTSKDKWDHIDYLKANVSRQNKKWDRYAHGGRKKQFSDRDEIKKKRKIDSSKEELVSYDMPDLMEEKVISEMGIPARASSPIPKYQQESFVSPVAVKPPAEVAAAAAAGKQEDSSFPSDSSLMQTTPMREIGYSDASMREIEHEQPASMREIEYKQPSVEMENLQPGTLSRQERHIEIDPRDVFRTDPQPPQPEPLDSAIVESVPSSSTGSFSRSKQKQITSIAPPGIHDIVKKRRLKSLGSISRGIQPKRLRDQKSYDSAIDELEQLHGIADLQPIADNYNWDDFDVDFLTKKKKLSKRKWQQKNSGSKDKLINPRSTRYVIKEPSPKKKKTKKSKSDSA